MTHSLQTNSSVTSIDTKAMEAELKELRYHLERKVEQRTTQLARRIKLLESCNATLCDKLELVQREFTALKQQPTVQVTRSHPVAQSMSIKQTAQAATGRVVPALLN